jgi:hypothetical protein
MSVTKTYFVPPVVIHLLHSTLIPAEVVRAYWWSVDALRNTSIDQVYCCGSEFLLQVLTLFMQSSQLLPGTRTQYKRPPVLD